MSQNDKLFKDLDKLKASCNNIENTIEKNISDAYTRQLMQIGAKVVEELQGYILAEWYSKYTPKAYDRTFSLIDGLRYRVNGKNLTILYDLRRFKKPAFTFDTNVWKPYVSFNGGDFKEPLVSFILNEDGTHDFLGGVNTNPRAYANSINLSDMANQLIKKYTKDIKFDFIIKDIISEEMED